MSNNNTDYSPDSYDKEAFAERLTFAIGDKSYRSVATQIGLSDSGLKRYFKDGTIPPIDKALDLASVLNVDFVWLCTGKGSPRPITTANSVNEPIAVYPSSALTDDNNDIVWIDSYDVFASAGNGFINDHEQRDKLPFSSRWLSDNGLKADRLSLIRVTGDSMYPTLRDKEIPLVEILPDDAINRLAEDVYVIRLNGQLLIKRIQVYGNGGFLIKSDNPHYDSYQLTKDNWPDDFKVIAKWTGKKF